MTRIGRFVRILAAGTVVMLIAGCARQDPSPDPQHQTAAEQQAPLTLSLAPESGSPGTEVTLRVRSKAEVKLPQSGPQGAWAAHVCWGECRPTEGQLVFFEPAPGEPGTLSGRMRAPAFHTGYLLPEGPQKVTVACRTKGCDGVPEASATFRVTGALSKVAWAALPAAAAPGMPNLSGAVRDAVDPANPNRKVVCKGGSVTPDDPMGPPELQVSEDAGKTWWSIPLKEVKLGQHSGMAGCRAVALDPHQKNTFYLAGAGHMAAYGWDRDPAPLYTVDVGQTWKQVPAPEGYGQPEAFIGYTMTPEGVSAWFGKPGLGASITSEAL